LDPLHQGVGELIRVFVSPSSPGLVLKPRSGGRWPCWGRVGGVSPHTHELLVELLSHLVESFISVKHVLSLRKREAVVAPLFTTLLLDGTKNEVGTVIAIDQSLTGLLDHLGESLRGFVDVDHHQLRKHGMLSMVTPAPMRTPAP
jgi:hypothetical protein